MPLAMSAPKKYGLILPDKSKPQLSFQATRNVFGDDSESDDDTKKNNPPLSINANVKRQTKLTQEKAILEDPSVYQYDEIYDSMTVNKQKQVKRDKEDKKPKYIENLIKTANKRKIENERRIERQVQKEREQEGEEFADKEVFVTSAYKKKLEEMKLEEEKEKYEEYLESIGDVTQQKDLGGFYRHLYEQKLGTEKKKTAQTPENKPPKGTNDPDKNKAIVTKAQSKQRNYRKRKSSHDIKLSEGEIEDSEEEIIRCNLEDIRTSKNSKHSKDNIDADSDFSIEESSDEESKEDSNKNAEEKNKPVDVQSPEKNKENVNKEKPEAPKEPEKTKMKIDIWKKRCVGELFDQALKRYYERKAARNI